MKKLFLVLLLCSFWVNAEPININQADAEAISTALTGVGPKKPRPSCSIARSMVILKV